jgi:hypothetical protein
MAFITLDQVTGTRVQWLWPGRLALGHLAIFDGDPGLGKSLVTLDLCARITTGRPFPDGTGGGEPARVIVINAEDGARDTVRGRLSAAGADLSRVHAFERSPGESFLRLPGHLNRLEDAIARTGARYVVVDPILSFLDARVNVASDHSVRAALAPLADLAARHRCTIQMVRHLNKGAGKNPLYRGLYSIGFVASCRVSWFVARDPCLAQFVVTQPKSNLDPPQPGLAYTIESADGQARIAWHGISSCTERDLFTGTPSRLLLRLRAQEFLLNFLKDGPRNTREIWEAAKMLPFSARTLDRARKRLNVASVPVHVGAPQQTNYWLLPGQELPRDRGIDESTLAVDAMLGKLAQENPGLTPLDEQVGRHE